MLRLFKTGFNIYTVLLIATGLTIVTIAVAKLIFHYPIFGIAMDAQTYILLILLKVGLATVHMLTFTQTA